MIRHTILGNIYYGLLDSGYSPGEAYEWISTTCSCTQAELSWLWDLTDRLLLDKVNYYNELTH